ncbi:TetR family transcriptional regulator [Mycobacterium saskatchewanense]|uniref:HTH tetR-type domain-containing protein n=1 Tax=Mycobacterium saskatchewanense TaxID=220927 RepID=A0AAJ3TW09_9MYCO|nr:TetR/AcrR family transcriptional regulator [Mycobacterium saskatchewanense]ORW72901.1 hypothetical protein AWC23_08575 [Mycobacterium saskatchewanense]BBX62572.1 TetR family transcriptional regulator [Mycobacterium saskatchewanense]
MARPKVPLISREVALEAALRIIDSDGLEALSIRRLAAELKVNGASLYYHFANKEAILVEVTELALARTPINVRSDGSDWKRWMLDGARQLLDLLLAHPGLIPIIVKRRTLGVRAEALEVITRKLVSRGVPAEVILPLYEATERFVIGTAVRQVSGEAVLNTIHDTRHPHLQLAAVTRGSSHDELFDVVLVGIMETIHRTAAESPVGATDAEAPASSSGQAEPRLGRSPGDFDAGPVGGGFAPAQRTTRRRAGRQPRTD